MSAPTKPPKSPPEFPPWLSACCLLLCVILAWFALRRVLPLPDGWNLPLAVVLICLGLATWWPAARAPFARARSLRPFSLFDLLPIACATLGGMLLLAAFLGWGARPLESAADHVSNLVWGNPDEDPNQKDSSPPPPEPARPPSNGDTLASWSNRSLPPDSTSAARPDAPPLLLTFQNADDLARWKNRTIYVRVAALEVPGPFANDWSPLPVQPASLSDADDGTTDGQITNPEAPTHDQEHPVPWSIFTPADTTIVPSLLGLFTLRADAVNRQSAAIWEMAAPTTSFAGTSHPQVASAPDSTLPDTRPVPVPTDANPTNPLLALPDDRLGDKIRALARDFDTTLSIRDLAAAVPAWLATRCRYHEVYSNPNELPALIQFLEVGRTGICEHFAASGVLLFRALGLPSRLAYGYAGGTLAESSRQITFGARDFHAWAEILVPGQGWVAVECTPPGTGAARTPQPAPESPAQPPDPSPPEVTPTPTSTWKSLARIAGAALTLFLIAWLAARWRLSARTRRENHPSTPRLPQPPWFKEFLTACDRLGAPRRPGRTTREHLDFLRRARLSNDQIEDLINHYHSVRYDGQADHRATEMSTIVANWLNHHLDLHREKKNN